MAGKDDFHAKNPKVNAWMNKEAKAGAVGLQTSNQIERLARRTGQDPVELSRKIPRDTVRRTQFPVLEQRDEEGRRVFKHDSGIQDDGRMALVRK